MNRVERIHIYNDDVHNENSEKQQILISTKVFSENELSESEFSKRYQL